jgi:hypothetical protein
MKKSIFLIERMWLDPLENESCRAMGYECFRYVETLEEAEKFCKESSKLTNKDCWAIGRNKELPRFRYKEIKNLMK